jgi:aldehyde dehydrogenase (NAD+)
MNIDRIESILKSQRVFFASGKTRNVQFRIESLKKLRAMIKNNEKQFMDALYADLHKSPFESYASEIGLILNEIDHHIKHVKSWSKTQRKVSPITIFPSKSYIRHEPYGICFIMAPWNYPLGLLLTPLLGAISAGNCAVLKPANYTHATALLLERLIEETFPENYISIFTGGRDVNAKLLAAQYDYIFFTGGPALGKIVADAAVQHFTPFTLELGGKSPCIVDEDANLKRAARRIVWGKCLNLGQTCIAPDHLYVHESVKNELIELMRDEIKAQFGDDPQKSPDLGRMITDSAFQRVSSYIQDAKILLGGQVDAQDKYIAPTLLEIQDESIPLMQEEIFGPVLPVISFNSIEMLADKISMKDKPLALYYFTSNKKKADTVLSKIDSGGVCINDVLIHFVNDKIPFGGVGKSGMGSYHGKFSFDTFSRKRGMVISSTHFDIPVKFAPYKKKLSLLKKFLK